MNDHLHLNTSDAPVDYRGREGNGNIIVEIYDPPMCCPTGLCGPAIDPVLVEVNEMVLNLKADGVRVERYSPRSHSRAFVDNREVYTLVRERQMAALPVTVVNGKVIKTGAYPTIDEVRSALAATRPIA